jgi:hydrogenase expression/formation protein HypE
MNIQGVLFDFDGTLTAPGAIDFSAIKQEVGCPLDETVLEYLEAQPAERRTALMKILVQKEEAAAEASRPNEGAERCLLELKERNFVLGILTRNSLNSVKKSLNKFRGVSINDFGIIITRDTSQPKPHPDGVLRAATEMGLKPSQLMVVGDFRFDIIAGKEAGSVTVLLATKGRSVMEPGDPDPDYMIEKLEDILDIF